ncbi:uncharacterized protein PAC_05024 [Phialocephala subalpina]|uniref:Uncharacterized protein n=1 Tax=Phialocephala subalpina TaxID=576137 RepID=A0A1L7WQU4_9HELO|nr:uncharacterized protein PAC_05024 [Phialocephala subalpina]
MTAFAVPTCQNDVGHEGCSNGYHEFAVPQLVLCGRGGPARQPVRCCTLAASDDYELLDSIPQPSVRSFIHPGCLFSNGPPEDSVDPGQALRVCEGPFHSGR